MWYSTTDREKSDYIKRVQKTAALAAVITFAHAAALVASCGPSLQQQTILQRISDQAVKACKAQNRLIKCAMPQSAECEAATLVCKAALTCVEGAATANHDIQKMRIALTDTGVAPAEELTARDSYADALKVCAVKGWR